MCRGPDSCTRIRCFDCATAWRALSSRYFFLCSYLLSATSAWYELFVARTACR